MKWYGTVRASFVVLLVLAGLHGPAVAATLHSPPLSVGEQGTIECKVLNVSEQPRTVSMDIRTDEGVSLIDLPLPPSPLAPGEVRSLSISAGPCLFEPTKNCEPSYCRFFVDGRRKTVRASACVRDLDGCTAVVPAQ